MDLVKISRLIKKFINNNKAGLYSLSQNQSKILEIAWTVGIAYHYQSNGYNMEIINPNFAEGYKSSADLLVKNALESKNIKILDTFIFPIMFLYRQYLELELKWIIIRFLEENACTKKKILKDISHNLIKAWRIAKPIMLEYTEKKEKDDVKIVEEYINQFHRMDKGSFSFRYPIMKNLDRIFNKEKKVNLKIILLRMNELYHFFDGVEGKLESIRDYKLEMCNYLP